MPKLHKYQDSDNNRKQLLGFYREVYSTIPEMTIKSRFEWQSFKNPNETSDETPLIWVLQNESNSLVGHNSLLKYNLIIGGDRYNGYCSTNLLVIPGTEGKGLGHILIGNNESQPGVAFAVGITIMASRAFQKRGWVLIEDAKLHTLIKHQYKTLRFLKQSVVLSLLATPVLKFIEYCLTLRRQIACPPLPQGVESRMISEFESRWDSYWQQFLSDYAIHYEREAAFLNYKYFSRNDVKHRAFIFERNDEPVGYLVIRKSTSKLKNITLGRIVDLVYNPQLGFDLVASMVAFAIDEFKKYNVDSIVAVSSSAEISKAFRVNGLMFKKTQPAIILESDFSIETLRKKYKNIWYIMLSDSDMDNYW
ncbi:MAG: hypothetical protein KAR42_01670 [candidate division Zixibacteria bacterium]|nr:hypothetical protein [candidate division Zixibacteria bacterium]